MSNVALGVYTDLTSVPLPDLMAAGASIALGADDPLLFGSRLAGQYATMRAAHDLTDDQLADLARSSIRGLAGPGAGQDDLAGRDRRLVGDNGGMTQLPRRAAPDPLTSSRLTSAQVAEQARDRSSRVTPRRRRATPRRSPRPRLDRSSTRARPSRSTASRSPAEYSQPEYSQPQLRAARVRAAPRAAPYGQPALRTGAVRPASTASPTASPSTGSLSTRATVRPAPYAPMPYGAYAPPPPNHPQATTSMVLGIVGLVGDPPGVRR